MVKDNQPIVVNLPEGQNTLTLLQGEAPRQLDNLAPVKINISGVIEAPLEFLKKRIGDIDQHKAHILVCRDILTIHLVIAEDDEYLQGNVVGRLQISRAFMQFGINSDKQWEPEQLGQFLKLQRTYFANRDENMKVGTQKLIVKFDSNPDYVAAPLTATIKITKEATKLTAAKKTFKAKVDQTVERETKENGNKAFAFRQAVESNIPESFKLRLPVLSGGAPVEIDVETYASIDGGHVSIALQSPGANDIIENVRNNLISGIIEQLRDVAPEIVIIEQ